MKEPEGIPVNFWDSLCEPFEGTPQAFRILDFDVVLNLPEALAQRIRSHLVLQGTDSPAVRSHQVKVFRSPKSQFQAPKVRPFDYHVEFVHGREALDFHAYYFAGRIPYTNGEAMLALGSASEANLQTEVENFLRVYTAMLLVREGAFLLHSSAAVVGREAYVFFGHSGAGKSTSALLFRDAGHRVLSDDLNILCEREGRWYVQASPYVSEVRRVEPGLFPVRRLFFLFKARDNRIQAVPLPLQMAYLLSNIVVVNGIPGLYAPLIEVLNRLLPRLPVEALHFRNDKEFAPWILSHA
jgi:hypothetical protein